MPLWPDKCSVYPKMVNLNNFLFTDTTDVQYLVRMATFNKTSANFAPVFWKNKIVFSATETSNEKNTNKTKDSFSKLYLYDPETSGVVSFSDVINMKYNTGACIFYENGNKMLFSANEPSKTYKNTFLIKLYYSIYLNNTWTKPHPIDFNFPKHNNAHPAMSKSGHLLVFASDVHRSRDMDLYFCTKDKNDHWKSPVRLPDYINSIGNEVFPVFINDSILIFSSDGLHPTTGKLDFYKTVLHDTEFSQPELLSYPFNSAGDDFTFLTDDNFNSGYFTSDRDNSEGDVKIYYFEKQKKTQNTRDTIVELLTFKKVTICGKLFGGADIQNSGYSISFFDLKGNLKYNVQSDSTGTFYLVLSEPEWVIYKIKKEGYYEITGSVSPDDYDENDTLNLKISFDKIKINPKFCPEKIYYNLASWNITSNDKEKLKKLFEYLLLNPAIHIEIQSHTDVRGSVESNLRLSQKRAQTVFNYLVGLGISTDRIKMKGFGSSLIVNHCNQGTNCPDEEHRANRRTEIMISEN
jgi:outer membrane protein OmpA-like peptidoglycan-associated protein